ncbi:MAG: hypothetical protein RJB38_1950 [Pseudomonadota bacterium]|jgi:CheY-specific phosphatase CheX
MSIQIENKLKLLDAAFKAVQETFKQMIDVDVSRGPISSREENPLLGDINVIASIPLRTPPNFDGELFLYLPERIYLFILSKMVGQLLTMDSEEAKTGAGEILNIVGGHVNLMLAKDGFSIKQDQLPRILSEQERKTLSSLLSDGLMMTFNSAMGAFFVEVIES